jgi:hypothetical protein
MQVNWSLICDIGSVYPAVGSGAAQCVYHLNPKLFFGPGVACNPDCIWLSGMHPAGEKNSLARTSWGNNNGDGHFAIGIEDVEESSSFDVESR